MKTFSLCDTPYPMRTFTQNEPLTDAELDHLGDFLKNCKGGRAMNVEVLDGFFAALIAGPKAVMPSEYYREVFGGEIVDTCVFASISQSNLRAVECTASVQPGGFSTWISSCWTSIESGSRTLT